MGNTVISNIIRFEIDTTAFSPLLKSYIGMKRVVFSTGDTDGRVDMLTLTHHERTPLQSKHYHWSTQHWMGKAFFRFQSVTQTYLLPVSFSFFSYGKAPEGSFFHPINSSVKLERAHKILLGLNLYLLIGPWHLSNTKAIHLKVSCSERKISECTLCSPSIFYYV